MGGKLDILGENELDHESNKRSREVSQITISNGVRNLDFNTLTTEKPAVANPISRQVIVTLG